MNTDLSIAKKSLSEENQAIKDYTDRLRVASSPILRKALEHARREEIDHASDFRKAIEKIARLRYNPYFIRLRNR